MAELYRALLIGVSKYTHVDELKPCELEQLPGVDADLASLHAALQDPEFCRYDEVTVVPSGNENSPDAALIAYKINQFLKSAEDGERLCIYFSGHGYPHEGRVRLCGSKFSMEDVPRCTVGKDEIIDTLANCKAQAVLLILDCCHAGLGDLPTLAGRTEADSIEGFTAKGDQGATAVVQPFMIGDGDEKEKELRGFALLQATNLGKALATTEGSVFTQTIVRGLRGEAQAKEDTDVSAEDLSEFVKGEFAKDPKLRRLANEVKYAPFPHNLPPFRVASRMAAQADARPSPEPSEIRVRVSSAGVSLVGGKLVEPLDLCHDDMVRRLEYIVAVRELVDAYSILDASYAELLSVQKLSPQVKPTFEEMPRLQALLSEKLAQTINAQVIVEALDNRSGHASDAGAEPDDVALDQDWIVQFEVDGVAELAALPWEELLTCSGAWGRQKEANRSTSLLARRVPVDERSDFKAATPGIAVAVVSLYRDDDEAARALFDQAVKKLNDLQDQGVRLAEPLYSCTSKSLQDALDTDLDIVVLQGAIAGSELRGGGVQVSAELIGGVLLEHKPRLIAVETIAGKSVSPTRDLLAFGTQLAHAARRPVYLNRYPGQAPKDMTVTAGDALAESLSATPANVARALANAHQTLMGKMDLKAPFARSFTFWPDPKSPAEKLRDKEPDETVGSEVGSSGDGGSVRTVSPRALAHGTGPAQVPR